MDINWKTVAQSQGYKSLKTAYIKDVHAAGQKTNTGRKKEDFLRLFQWVIGRAQHYAYLYGMPIEVVLTTWEAKRDYWWLNYYGESHQPKLPSGKPRNVKHMTDATWLKKQHRDKITRFQLLVSRRQKAAKNAREALGKKARWSAARKKNTARLRAYRKQSL